MIVIDSVSGDAEDLNAQRSRSRAVELGHQDPLPLPEHDFTAADLQREVVAEEHRAQVRVGVHPIAVRVLRIVVHALGVAGDHLLEEALDVGEQRDLELVDEERARRVHRPEADQPFADVETPDEFHDPVGQIDELDALIGLDDERLAVNRQVADRRADATSSTGFRGRSDGRTLAHALPQLAPIIRCPVAANDQTMLRKNERLSGNLLYAPRSCGPRTGAAGATTALRMRQSDADPGGYAKWCNSHTVPPL
mgnify:CR=1 FL=1